MKLHGGQVRIKDKTGQTLTMTTMATDDIELSVHNVTMHLSAEELRKALILLSGVDFRNANE